MNDGIVLEFAAKFIVRNDKETFPNDIVHTVIICNRDDCSYVELNKPTEGCYYVQYNMHPLVKNVLLTDTLKFHVFFKDVASGELVQIAAGWLRIHDLIDIIEKKSLFKFSHNYVNNSVEMLAMTSAQKLGRMKNDLQRLDASKLLTSSFLMKTKSYDTLLCTISDDLERKLATVLNIKKENGGHMFKNLLCAHMMCGQMSSYYTYYDEFVRPFVPMFPPWLMMYCIAETLCFRHCSIDAVKQSNIDQIAEFIGYCAQSILRSANSSVYFSDYTLDPSNVKTPSKLCSENLKRAFCLPKTCRKSIILDDCEGSATYICLFLEYMGYFYDKYNAFLRKGFVLSDPENALLSQKVMSECFPSSKFAMTPLEKQQMILFALTLGEYVSSKKVIPLFNVVSAYAPSFDDHAKKSVTMIQGHACASIQWTGLNGTREKLLEGTVCVDDLVNTVKLDTGIKGVDTLDELLNVSVLGLSDDPGNIDKTKVRYTMHTSHGTSKFYESIFFRNGNLMGTVDPETKEVTYGVPYHSLHDLQHQIIMPLNADDKVKKVIELAKERTSELFLPFQPYKDFMDQFNWFPMKLCKGTEQLSSNTHYVTNMLTKTVDSKEVDAELSKLASTCNELNKRQTKQTVHSVYLAFDSITRAMQLICDDKEALERYVQTQCKPKEGASKAPTASTGTSSKT